jgi:1,4-dihydroxy-6-naphthoate synthase
VIETATLTLAYSPCPNDTYIFAALAHGLLEGGAPSVRVTLADVETLNEAAANGTYELTKISYGAIPYVSRRYRILRSGGALGRGCGPLLVTRADEPYGLSELRARRVAIPGERTTAFLLLRLALHATGVTGLLPVSLRFDRIIDAVARGEVDAGLIIHESRFTYAQSGLRSILDLGDWWEHQTGLPIPLGAIVARHDIGIARARSVGEAIARSLAFAHTHEPEIMPHVREHALEMDEDVMRRHIDLYVNEFSEEIGDLGIAAVRELFARAYAAGLLAEAAEPRFA